GWRGAGAGRAGGRARAGVSPTGTRHLHSSAAPRPPSHSGVRVILTGIMSPPLGRHAQDAGNRRRNAGAPGRLIAPGIAHGAVTVRRGVTSVRLLGGSNGSA